MPRVFCFLVKEDMYWPFLYLLWRKMTEHVYKFFFANIIVKPLFLDIGGYEATN